MPGVVETFGRSVMPQATPFIIGVAGGTASGKSSVCKKIMERLSQQHRRQVIAISQDSFYRRLTEDETKKADRGEFNFDHPEAFELSLLISSLTSLKNGESVIIPKYDYKTNSRVENDSLSVAPVDVILVEGILIFYEKELRELFNMKLFVDADPDIRLARRVQRDIQDRGRTLTNVLHQYLNLVKPAYEEFSLPTKKYADVIIPRGAENEVAIDLIVQHIQDLLRSSPRGSLTCVTAATQPLTPTTPPLTPHGPAPPQQSPMSPGRRGRQRPH